ncbi:MAG: type II toxin-antitoxin system YafQ family toxin [Clostridia bacterium]|nr:type II toxin-antitoxin system YafQ family toxin [Clostridia bacterium]
MKYEIRLTSRFKKDVKLIQKQGKDLEKLFSVVEKIAEGEELAPSFRDHSLSGEYSGCRECHIEPERVTGAIRTRF